MGYCLSVVVVVISLNSFSLFVFMSSPDASTCEELISGAPWIEVLTETELYEDEVRQSYFMMFFFRV